MTACRCVDAVAARVHHLASRDPLHPRPFAQTAEGDIYDLKTEKEYEEIVNDRRQQNDFVVDDGKSCAQSWPLVRRPARPDSRWPDPLRLCVLRPHAIAVTGTRTAASSSRLLITVTDGRDINAYSFFPAENEIPLSPRIASP